LNPDLCTAKKDCSGPTLMYPRPDHRGENSTSAVIIPGQTCLR
jgi:hypothetical protein